MANLIRRDGKLFHGDEEIAPADALDGIAHLDSASVLRDTRDGRIVIAGSGFTVSLPADVAAQLVTAAAELAPDAKAEEVTRLVAAQEVRMARELADAKARTTRELDQVKEAAADELATIERQIEEKRAELGETDGKAEDSRV